MDQRVSVITLGVGDVRRAQTFHDAVGWRLDAGVDDETDRIAFYQAGGLCTMPAGRFMGTARWA